MADTKISGLTALTAPTNADLLVVVDVSDTTMAASGTNKKVTVEVLGGLVSRGVCQGRLTTESGVPVSTSDRTSQGTLYFTPYNGNLISLYDGTNWELFTFTQLSLDLSTAEGGGAIDTGENYDVFIYDNAGTLTLELSAQWTNDTTRADALTTQDGVYVKSGATTRRWLGTIRASGSGVTEDSGFKSTTAAAKRFVWNYYNQVFRPLCVEEDTSSWSYTTVDTWRQVRASADNQVEVVVGAPAAIDLEASLVGQRTAGTPPAYCAVGIGRDATNALASVCNSYYQSTPITYTTYPVRGLYAHVSEMVPLGYHYYAWLEVQGGTSANHSFFGTSAGSRSSQMVGGVMG